MTSKRRIPAMKDGQPIDFRMALPLNNSLKKKKMRPAVSVMLCAYNASRYIREAINSVLEQTYKDFEFVIVDDGSSDNTLNIVLGYSDSRIRVIHREHNYIESLNAGIKACRGEFIARMDADDKIASNRLERQLETMRQYPELTVCFSWGRTFGYVDEPIGHCAKGWVKNPYFWFVTGNYLMHPTAMIRNSFLRKHRIRYKGYPYAEDYKLWTDIARLNGTFYVIPEQLFFYRISKSQVSVKNRKEQRATRLAIQQEVVEELLRRLKHPQKKTIETLYHRMLMLNKAELMQGSEVITTMYRLIRRTHYFV